MIGGCIGKFIGFIQTMRLYARVGLKRITLKKAYVMLRYWILTNIFKRSIPWLIELSVTYRCQCTCKHCSVAKYLADAKNRKKDELTGDEIKSVLSQAVKMGIPKVDFFGGEPLLRKDIVDLVRFGSEIGLYISITSNAWLLSKELTKELRQAGLSCMHISLDSISEEEHDKLRGLSGLYKRVLNGVRYCYEEGIPCILSTYVIRERIEGFGKGCLDNSQLSSMISFAKKAHASALRILLPMLSGKWAGDKKVGFTEEEESQVIGNLDLSFAFIEGAFAVVKKKKVCQALTGKVINISPYGQLQLCVIYPDVFGNVKDTPLKDLLIGMWNHPTYIKNKGRRICSTTALKR